MTKFGWNTFLPALLLTLAGFVVAYQFVDPAPAAYLTISTGSEQGAYYKFARQYQSVLKKNGIELSVEKSGGSIQNLERLRQDEVDVAFVQGGTSTEADQGLLSLGSLYFEPLWVFYRAELEPELLTDLSGLHLAIGPDSSGTQALVRLLLEDNGLNHSVSISELGGLEARDALLSGAVDVAFYVASPESKIVTELLSSERVGLLSFERAEAYTRRFGFLSLVSLPRGMVDMAQDLPGESATLLAPTANLVVRQGLHPALQDMLLQAMDQIHGAGGWFEGAGQFPKASHAELTVSPEASRFYRYGPPLLQRYFPFWAASLVDRLKVMLLPLVVILIPLIKIMPPIYTWRMRSRIYRWYQLLEQVDLKTVDADVDRTQLLTQLADLEQEVIHVNVPLSYTSQLYDLRQHIELVRLRVTETG